MFINIAISLALRNIKPIASTRYVDEHLNSTLLRVTYHQNSSLLVVRYTDIDEHGMVRMDIGELLAGYAGAVGGAADRCGLLSANCSIDGGCLLLNRFGVNDVLLFDRDQSERISYDGYLYDIGGAGVYYDAECEHCRLHRFSPVFYLDGSANAFVHLGINADRAEELAIGADVDLHLISDYSQFMANAQRIRYVDMADANSGAVASTQGMFEGCASLAVARLFRSASTSDANTERMFNGCGKLRSIDLSGWAGSVAKCSSMFTGCSSVRTIDLGGLDFVDGFDDSALRDCGALESMYYMRDGGMLPQGNCIMAFDSSQMRYVRGWNRVHIVSRGGEHDVFVCEDEKISKEDMYSVLGKTVGLSAIRGYASAHNAFDSEHMYVNSTYNEFYMITDEADYFDYGQYRYYLKDVVPPGDSTGYRVGCVGMIARDASLVLGRFCRMFYHDGSMVTISMFSSSYIGDDGQELAGNGDVERITFDSGFSFDGITDMSRAFAGFGSAGYLDLTGFDLSAASKYNGFCMNSGFEVVEFNRNVKIRASDMANMFSSCGNIRELDLSMFHCTESASLAGLVSNVALDVLDIRNMRFTAGQLGQNAIARDVRMVYIHRDIGQDAIDGCFGKGYTELEHFGSGRCLVSSAYVNDVEAFALADNVYNRTYIDSVVADQSSRVIRLGNSSFVEADSTATCEVGDISGRVISIGMYTSSDDLYISCAYSGAIEEVLDNEPLVISCNNNKLSIDYSHLSNRPYIEYVIIY